MAYMWLVLMSAFSFPMSLQQVSSRNVLKQLHKYVIVHCSVIGLLFTKPLMEFVVLVVGDSTPCRESVVKQILME